MAKFFGALLMAIGLLIATLSGLCSAGFLMSLANGRGSGGHLNGAALMFVSVVGGVPFLGGVGMFLGGLTLVRSGRERGK